MKSSYIHALEMRAKWLRYANETADRIHAHQPEMSHVYRTYAYCLEHGESYFMNRNFCDLVDHARQDIPDDVLFEDNWMLSPSGFLWLEKPFRVPAPADATPEETSLMGEPHISAIGWMPIHTVDKNQQGYYFTCFIDHARLYPGAVAFGCWSHFALGEGKKMIDKVHGFETYANRDRLAEQYGAGDGLYAQGPAMEKLHEIRWAYTAMHLMSQRLAHHSEERASGMARESARRKRLQIAPVLKLVSLRRMEQDRPKQRPGEHKQVDWQWQWIVGGHWRLQPYKTLGDYKWKFVESYVKGPDDKPLKAPAQAVIYKAER
jgi:hypothetical protein